MKLILVESPTKAKTLSKYLGKEYRIEATMGHIRDLPKSDLGVDIDHDFSPRYIVPRDKKKRVDELKEFASHASDIILASDPDREGEAIAWHVATILSEEAQKKKKGKLEKKGKKESENTQKAPVHLSRITFHEITETAIKKALSHPGTIDMKMVDAQQARRVLDRLVGYKLSPVLWKKLSKRWLSAGRVQSVVVRLIVEREREIAKFTKIPFFTIDGVFENEEKVSIIAQLVSHNGEKFEETLAFDLFDGKYSTTKTSIQSEDQAHKIITEFQKPFSVSAVEKKEIRRSPNAPYTTSTLQQDAGRKMYFSSKKTMQLAQKLYEEGFITYHRTDSVNLSEKFVDEAREYIKSTFGDSFLPDEPRKFHTKSKVAQEAHEAIRPTRVTVKSNDLEGNPEFNHDHIRLYELIWKRAIASQGKDAVFDSTTIVITSANAYVFQIQGSVIKFEGFIKIIGKENGETVLPQLKVGEMVSLVDTHVVPHETTPPPRYTEAALVKTLEEKDIGRPSTYAPIISTIIERQYVKKEEKKMVPTELGGQVIDFLVLYFPEILSLPFTANMEDSLDAIATGTKKWVPVLRSFWESFSKLLDHAMETAEKVKLPEEKIEEKCPLDGGDLVIRQGRYGKFIACTNFPVCRYTKQYGETIDIPCPKCGGKIVIKKSKRGKTFYGCSNYPSCTFAAWKKEDIK